jgi:hypothetical protein
MLIKEARSILQTNGKKIKTIALPANDLLKLKRLVDLDKI